MATSFWGLPTEIWLLIAEHFTAFQLFELKSVNSFFLNCWMDFSWKSVLVEIHDYPETAERAARLLERVVDPFVAVRAKSLTISLDLEERSSSSSFDTILDVLLLLPNITSLNIRVSKASTFHVVALFQIITSCSMPRTLQQLSLTEHVTVEMLALLGEHAHKTPFESLVRFTLVLDCSKNSSTQTEPLTLEPFLRSIAPTLQILHMFNISPVLDALQTLSQFDTPVPFPNLKSLYLYSHTCPSSQSLRSFFITLNNLQHLHLNFFPNVDNEKRLAAWLADLVNNNSQFPSLQSLDIYPSTTQAGLSAVLTLIKLTASTLSSLIISKRYLTFEEAKQVVDAFTASEVQVQGTTTTTPSTEEPKKLKSLSLNLTHLSVSFLDLLAHKLPQLEKLSLLVSEIIGSDQNESFYDLLHHRRYNPSVTCTQDVLHTWKLQELSISRSLNWQHEMEAVRAVAGVVPTLFRAMGLR